MKNKREVTIYDIAEELNVSPSTVSRALKDHHSIGSETRKAVKKLASKRGYRPNSIAASLRNNKTNKIGIIVTWINSPFISSLISGVEIAAKKAGYDVVISQSHDSYENEMANAQTLYDSRVSGLVVSLAMETMNYDHFQKYIDSGIPVVFVDRVTEDLKSDLVVIDNFKAGFSATKHLIEQGCKRIAHIGGAKHRNVYRDRLEGYLVALRQYDLPIDEKLIINDNKLNVEEGSLAAEYLLNLEERPDGVFTANDNSAVSVIQAAKKRGIRIPEDLAVIGFNNDPVSLIIDPPLSTISHPAVDMGKMAAQQILKQRSDDVDGSMSIVLETELIVRASSMRNKKQQA